MDETVEWRTCQQRMFCLLRTRSQSRLHWDSPRTLISDTDMAFSVRPTGRGSLYNADMNRHHPLCNEHSSHHHDAQMNPPVHICCRPHDFL